MQDLLDEWLLAGWQPRPHDGLRDPLLPRRALSPNEMYAALVAAAGYLPLTLSVRIAAGDTILTDTPTSRIGLDAALPCEGCRGGYRPITKCVPEQKSRLRPSLRNAPVTSTQLRVIQAAIPDRR